MDTALSWGSARFQSTLLMRGATLLFFHTVLSVLISIHAPHARSDIKSQLLLSKSSAFQSTLLMRGATYKFDAGYYNDLFQSTLLMRGATRAAFFLARPQEISIHAPHARSDKHCHNDCGSIPFSYFNPRSSCEERLYAAMSSQLSMSDFNPRSSCEERHFNVSIFIRHRIISIHAPHARSDQHRLAFSNLRADFNPRSSCEERPIVSNFVGKISRFQSTLLMRGATDYPQPCVCAEAFQSTLLMRGATRYSKYAPAGQKFQSTLLMRGATRQRKERGGNPYFNPRSSCEERRNHSGL